MKKQPISPARLAELRSLSYSDYLHTPEWNSKRIQVFMRDGRRCRVCNSGVGINAHHRSYEQLGNEPLGDLITLCKACHSLFHKHSHIVRIAG